MTPMGHLNNSAFCQFRFQLIEQSVAWFLHTSSHNFFFCASNIWAVQQVCCSSHHHRRNSNICNCCSLRLIQRHHIIGYKQHLSASHSLRRCFFLRDPLLSTRRSKRIVTKLDPFRQSAVWIFIPPAARAKALSTPQQMMIILMDPLWVNIVKDKLRKSL